MLNKNNGTRNDKIARLVRVFAPFALLLFGVLVGNRILDSRSQNNQLPAPATEQTVSSSSGSAVATASVETPPVTATTAVSEESANPDEATSQPEPTLLPGKAAILTGPPAESVFSLSSPVVFYWQPAAAVADDQAFALYLAGENGEILVSILEEPNLGTGFQAHFVAENFDLPAGDYLWDVRLLQQLEGQILGLSDKRLIRFVKPED